MTATFFLDFTTVLPLPLLPLVRIWNYIINSTSITSSAFPWLASPLDYGRHI